MIVTTAEAADAAFRAGSSTSQLDRLLNSKWSPHPYSMRTNGRPRAHQTICNIDFSNTIPIKIDFCRPQG
jgi:hypothetical protein